MTSTCTQTLSHILESYARQYRVEGTDDGCEVVTPFLYPDNSPIVFEVAPVDGQTVRVTDNGEACDFAFVSGVTESSIRDRLKKVERRFGVDTTGQELNLTVPIDELGTASSNIIGAIQDVAYLVYRQVKRTAPRSFSTDVERFLVSKSWPYERNVQLPGVKTLRKIDYRVTPGGPRQLYLFAYEPPRSNAIDQKLDSILVTTRELGLTDQLDNYHRLAVLIDTAQGQSTQMENAIDRMKAWGIPNVLLWDSRNELHELIAA